jgi:hypothetical protein
LIALLGGGFGLLAARAVFQRRHQTAAASAAGLAAIHDLAHLPPALQRTALWSLSDGGFESRVVHGTVSRGAHDVGVTAFDLETLRERRGEWAYLPVDRPFRVGATVSVVVCEVDRAFRHVLLKREGAGDDLQQDDVLDQMTHLAKAARVGLGLGHSFPAELPPGLGKPALPGAPAHWRAYGDAALLADLLGGGVRDLLTSIERRDLVVELLDDLVVIYPAAHDATGADALADLTATALLVVDGVLAATRPLSPRGVEPR